ncbi:hypothetical protein F2Q69_00003395 [Brassica cretica]|uniref:Uncharacterized protein n=1 Tax=Brassica cretica TaxID=69181 RepID=A0A8S9NRZ1_BRACR|nr:hypothetical protein F2Q69_00003395 [Brassica cretica]
MNLGRELRRGCELSSSYRRSQVETDACSRGREMRLRQTRAVGDQERLRALADQVFASCNASKNNLGFFGIRVPKDQDSAAYCSCLNRTTKDQRRAEANGRGTAPIRSRCRELSRACFFSRTVASGRGFGLSWTWNTSKNNLGFFGIRISKDQYGVEYCFCECGRV